MKINKLFNDYLHNQIRKTSGDWDDIANVSDITDSFTDDKNNPFEEDYWQEKIRNKTKKDNINNDKKNKRLDIIV